jgi:hypothetical protein
MLPCGLARRILRREFRRRSGLLKHIGIRSLILFFLLSLACTPTPTPQQTTPIPPGIVDAPATVPAAPTPAVTPTVPTAAYTVQAGDTLSGIAARFGSVLPRFRRQNISDPRSFDRQTLRIPGSGEVLPTPVPRRHRVPAAHQPRCLWIYHTVQAGDTSIAARFDHRCGYRKQMGLAIPH